jgi:hypothetical protein
MAGARGTVVIPWYATGFRAEQFGRDLTKVAAAALRYGASSYAVYGSRDDKYRFQQFARFNDYLDWERYWDGPEMIYFRASHSSWYQVPVLYGWWDELAAGAVEDAELPAAGNGRGNGRRVGDIT